MASMSEMTLHDAAATIEQIYNQALEQKVDALEGIEEIRVRITPCDEIEATFLDEHLEWAGECLFHVKDNKIYDEDDNLIDTSSVEAFFEAEE